MDLNTIPETKPPLSLNEWARTSVMITCKWARFLSIVGFVICGLVVLIAIFAGSILSKRFPDAQDSGAVSSFAAVVIGIVYVIVAVVYFFPCLYLFRFSGKTKAALLSDDENTLAEGLDNLKKMFQFVGWMTAIVLSLYVLAFGFGLLGSMLALSR